MELATFLILFPLLPAVLLIGVRNEFFQKWIVIFSSAFIALASMGFAYLFMRSGGQMPVLLSSWPNKLVTIGDVLLSLVFLYLCRLLPLKRCWIPLLVVVQYGLLFYSEYRGVIPETEHYLFFDGLSAVMALVIGIVGTLIAIYTVGYMKHYHHEHPEVPNRTPYFMAAIFLFFSAMFGVIFSNSLTWLYFFWEITTLCSFIMISYSQKKEAVHNAFRALWMLMLGGLAFVMAILYLAKQCNTIELQQVMAMGSSLVLLPVLFLCFAGMNKAALYPFGNWLLGAMVAPTPSSALLHSSTMVKAGVYLVLRCSPVLKDTTAGAIVALIGGLSFLAGSALAISQRDGKRILAYSTIANLGLIVLCAGIGTSFTLWAAVLVIIFHAVAKALMFLCVGTVEHQTGSKDIEDMEGLISRMPGTTLTMLIGLSGMFLAPFGMLISKMAVIEALANRSPIFPPIVIFGGSLMLFFWTKWMGKLFAVSQPAITQEKGIGIEWVALWGLAFLTVLACVCYPIIGTKWLEPMYGWNLMLDHNVFVVIGLMLALMILPLIIFALRRKNLVYVAPYLGGANMADPRQFRNSLGNSQAWTFKNYYLARFFGERTLMKGTIILSILLFILMFLVEKL